MKKISTVGVVGAGTMGSALAQKFAQEGCTVVLADRTDTLLARGTGAIRATLDQAVERKLLSDEQALAALDRILPTTDLARLAICDLVIEAIYEDLQAKLDLFRNLGEILPSETIVATNTSSFSVSELARGITHPERFCGMHYFYHAAKNRLVEIIAGERTAPETIHAAERFAFVSNKDPIFCRDRHGFAVNRFFVPWLNEAVRLLEEGVASEAAIDSVCCEAFGVGMGPFALMNATGVPIAYHAQRTLESFGTLYSVAGRLRLQAESNTPWTIAARAETPSPEAARKIRDRMLGVVFLVCGQILDEDVCTPVDLNRGARIGLKWHRGPCDMMREIGIDEVDRLVRAVATRYQTPFPRTIRRAVDPLPYVSRRRAGGSSIITVNRPEDLNALNEEVVAQLSSCLEAAENDPECDTIVITGTGKAFVAGADLGLFVENMRNGTIDRIVAFTAGTHEVFARIETSRKRVIALVNGLALGGGLELALCADTILAVSDATMAYPETGLGIYPGLGGTQRTQSRVGKGLTKYLIYTGDMIGAHAARGMGLVDRVITTDEYFRILEGAPVSQTHAIATTDGDSRWEAINTFFEENTVEALLASPSVVDGLAQEEIARWTKRMRQKAPIALRTAEVLVDEARGTDSELEYLPVVFTSDDAMLGLTSVGQRVTFAGK